MELESDFVFWVVCCGCSCDWVWDGFSEAVVQEGVVLGGVGHEGGVVRGAEELVVGCEGALLGLDSDWHAVYLVVG